MDGGFWPGSLFSLPFRTRRDESSRVWRRLGWLGKYDTGRRSRRAGMKRLLYWLYERRLSRQIRAGEAPRHVGIILDGNRRYARKHRLADPCEAYNIGVEKLDDVLAWCAELQIRAVTLWVCSIDNLRRSPDEVSGILAAVDSQDRRIGLRYGDRSSWPSRESLGRSTFRRRRRSPCATGRSRHRRTYRAKPTIAIADGGREVSRTPCAISFAERIGRGASLEAIAAEITPEAIDGHLYTAGLPKSRPYHPHERRDPPVRFLLWQSAHSEFYFSDVNWPELRKVDFLRAVRSFQQRQRRYGR